MTEKFRVDQKKPRTCPKHPVAIGTTLPFPYSWTSFYNYIPEIPCSYFFCSWLSPSEVGGGGGRSVPLFSHEPFLSLTTSISMMSPPLLVRTPGWHRQDHGAVRIPLPMNPEAWPLCSHLPITRFKKGYTFRIAVGCRTEVTVGSNSFLGKGSGRVIIEYKKRVLF